MLFTNTNMRTAMAYTNAVGDKVYPIIVDIKKGIKSTEEVSFVSSDINTGVLSVAFIQGNDTYNVEGAEVICSIMRPDTTTLEIPCNTINGNTIEVPLGVNGTSQDGVYSFDFKVFKGGNKIVGTPIMNYSVSLSISNDLVVEEDDRLPVLTMLMTQVSELHDRTDEAVVKTNTATEASREATANAIEATNNANAVSERVSQETATAISEIKQDTANAIASMEQNTSTAISTMNQSTTDAIDSMNQSTTDAVTNMTQKTDEALSSMNQNTTNAIADMTQKTNEVVTMINNNLANVNNVVTTKVAELDNAKSDITTTVSNKIDEVENRFNALTSKQQQDAEVIDARDGETSLKARLDRDIEKAKQVYVNVEGSHISTDSSSGYAKDVEILGNTIQDASNLADIRSVGDKVEGQELYEIPVVSCGKNLITKLLYGNVSSEGNLLDNMGKQRVRTDFIEVDCKKEYRITNHSINNFANYVIRFAYDKDKKLLNNGGWNTYYYNNIQSFPEGTKYLIYEFTNEMPSVSDINIDDLAIQLEVGRQATPYEPYQEDKLTILSPVQLEKVGNVADRIIEKDGVWGVEKNIKTTIINENISIEKYGSLSNYQWFRTGALSDMVLGSVLPNRTTINNLRKRGNCLIDELGWSYGDSSHNYYFSIAISELSSVDATGCKEWLSKNNMLVKYPTTSPQFIPLPHDQQVKLRTFANKTNISFGCEIEGTIKAQVPKSLGATVNTHTEQISNLNKELDRVKKLEESTVSTVTTESDFTTVEATNGGYFEDVKLEGKTLVNLVVGSSVNIGVSTGTNAKYSHIQTLKPNTTYTCIVEIKDLILGTSVSVDISHNSGNNPHKSITANGIYVYTFSTPSDITWYKNTWVYFRHGSTGCSGVVNSLIILEGDHTQNPPNFFEGLKSAGQSATTSEDGADEIVVSSVNENLFDCEVVNGFINADTGVENNDVNQWAKTKSFIRVSPSTKYCISSKKTSTYFNAVIYYDSNRQCIGSNFPLNENNYALITTPHNAQYIKLRFRNYSGNSAILSDIQECLVIKSISEQPYTPHISDKKRLLYYNNETQAWEKPILRQWDSIEKHADGKYYYHQRSGEVVLNGSENWFLYSGVNLEQTLLFGLTLADYLKGLGNNTLLADKIKCNVEILDDVEGIFNKNSHIKYNTIGFKILKSKLSTQDVQGFKQWLQTNNVTVVYQLAEEKVYECTNIDLITYANETNYIVECGAIVPRTTLKVHNNISNVVNILQEKVSLLENKFIEGLKKVLAGDMYSLAELLYPEDFVEENPENNIMLLPFE